jgi:hypothetical protein
MKSKLDLHKNVHESSAHWLDNIWNVVLFAQFLNVRLNFVQVVSRHSWKQTSIKLIKNINLIFKYSKNESENI